MPQPAALLAPAAIGLALPWLSRLARPALWGLVALCLLAGAARGSALEGRAGLRPGPVDARAVLLEPLAAGARDGVAVRLRGRRVVLVPPRHRPPPAAIGRGSELAVRGRLVALGSGPGDARLRRDGVAGRLLAGTVTATGARRGGAAGALDRFAAGAAGAYRAAAGERRGALVAGMTLGDAAAIGDGDADALRRSGLWHLVAASGGNVALVVAFALAAGWLLGWPDRARLGAAALAVAAYVPLAGAEPSIQRAGVMGLAALLALAAGRERRAADALALAAAATLAVDPHAVREVGWQLSFAAAAALVAGAAPLTRRLTARGVPVPLAAAAACTLLATVATAPVSLATFGELSLIGLVANLLVVPLVGLCVWSGLLAALLATPAPGVAALAAAPAGWCAGATLAIAEWASLRTHAVVGVEGALAIAAAAVAAWLLRPPWPVVALAAAVAAVLLVAAVPRPPGAPRLLVLDVGQGSAALLQAGDRGVLVDAGPPGGAVVRQLRAAGVRRLEALVLSHPALDHDGGAAAVLAAFPVGVVLDGGSPGGGPSHAAALAEARRRGVPVRPVRAGQRLGFGPLALRVRWPTAKVAGAGGDPNDRSAVVEATAGHLTALLPGDAEGNVLAALARPAGVLVVSHHGSDDPALPAVLRRVRPRAAVISVGAGNDYGHPTASTLTALARARVPALRTDRHGAIDLRATRPGGLTARRIAPR